MKSFSVVTQADLDEVYCDFDWKFDFIDKSERMYPNKL